ncbi:MAG: hypothetical protein IT252_06795 [Chitinophagaceae bacterium]|nr:hypothetical protein [Chitinophagaceae bacterium]
MKLKHYSFFNSGVKAINTRDNWDSVRLDESEPDYYIPTTIDAYEQLPSVVSSKPLAKWMANQIALVHANAIYSIGSGVAYVEYNVKKTAGIRVVVSDFTPSVMRLQALKVFDEVVELDITTQDPAISPGTVVYLGRIDTELTDAQLEQIFARLHRLKVQHICIVPAQLLTPKAALIEAYIFLKSILQRRPRTFCGYNRSLGLFRQLAARYYQLTFHKVEGKPVFWLHKKD